MTLSQVSARNLNDDSNETISSVQDRKLMGTPKLLKSLKLMKSPKLTQKQKLIWRNLPRSGDFIEIIPKKISKHNHLKKCLQEVLRKMTGKIVFVSQIEPKKFEDAHDVGNLMMSMQEDLNQFQRSKVWKLVSRPKEKSVISTKRDFRNKLIMKAML